MQDFQRERQKEKQKLKEDLEVARRDLPSAMAIIRSLPEATNVAVALNTSLEGKISEMGTGGLGDRGGPVENHRISTPADHVRRMYRSEGYHILSLEERQWLMLDKVSVIV